MSTLLDEIPARRSASPTERLRTTMAAARVSLSWLGTRKTLTAGQKSQAAESFGAEGAFLSAGKKLLDTSHPAFKAVTSVRNRVISYWKGISLPYPEPGIRLIRQDDIAALGVRLTTPKAELEEAVWRLDEHFAEQESAARDRLGSLFNSADYPDSPLGLLKVEWDFPSVEPPNYLRELSPELFRQEQARVAARFEEAVRMAEEAFTAELSKLVSHLTQRISGQEDGKPKIFRDTAVARNRLALRWAASNFRASRVRLSRPTAGNCSCSPVTSSPREEDVLATGARLFSCPELPGDQSVDVGKTDQHLVLAIGPWTIWLAIEAERRFPKVDDLVQSPEFAVNRCRFSAADARFVAQSLGDLPSDEELHHPAPGRPTGVVRRRAAAIAFGNGR